MSTRRASRRRICSIVALFNVIATFVFNIDPCDALSSRECKADVQARVESGEKLCGAPLCGYLELDDANRTFLGSMSLKCQALMWAYRDDTASVLGVTGAANRLCATSKEAYLPNNPVIVETEEVRNFMMCTVPRAASTNLRSLMNMLIRLPEEPRPSTTDQHWDAQFDIYPTVWHYRMNSHPTYDAYPSFIISRNPYIRLLSAFLNKMTVPMGQDGYWIVKNVNAALGMPPTKVWQATRPSFHEFVTALLRRKHGVAHLDPHFRLALRACSYGINYEYYLRIEDMAQWLPCMEDGLGLRKFTQHGWRDTEDGLTYVGSHASSSGDSCWWSPAGMSCADFYTRMMDERGEAVPVVTEAGGDFRLHETRDDGTTELWRDYYTQKIGDMVYKLYEEDFLAFGYGKEWFD
eukprot:jgi/Ulvmu1/159/UM001_0163.1